MLCPERWSRSSCRPHCLLGRIEWMVALYNVYQPRRHWKPLGTKLTWIITFFKPKRAEALRFFFLFNFDLQLPCFYFVTEFLIFTVMSSKVINGPQSMQNWWRLTLISILQTLHKTVTKRHQIKCLMSKTVAVHVHHNSLYISLPSSAKQQREMTNSALPEEGEP